MNRDFLIRSTQVNQAFEFNSGGSGTLRNGITRRSFIKRTGSATVATLVTFNIAEKARGATTLPFSGSGGVAPCTKTECITEPIRWGGTFQNPATPTTGYCVKVVWWVTGPSVGYITTIPVKQLLAVNAEVFVYIVVKVPHLPPVLTQIDQISGSAALQRVVCTAATCMVRHTPPIQTRTYTSTAGHTSLDLVIDHGDVTRIVATYRPPTSPPLTATVPVGGVQWTHRCQY